MSSDRQQFRDWIVAVYHALDAEDREQFTKHVSADLYPFFKAAVLPEDMVTVLIRHVMYKDGRIHTIVIPDNRYRTRDLDFSRLRHLRRVLFLDTAPPTEEILNRLNGTSVQSVYIVEGRLYEYDDDVEFLLPYEYDGLEDLDPEGKYSFGYTSKWRSYSPFTVLYYSCNITDSCVEVTAITLYTF